MKQQLRKMQEAIDYIREATDEELHEILISLGAKSTKPQAVSGRFKLRVSRTIVDDVLPHDESNTYKRVEKGGRVEPPSIIVAQYRSDGATSTFDKITPTGELVA